MNDAAPAGPARFNRIAAARGTAAAVALVVSLLLWSNIGLVRFPIDARQENHSLFAAVDTIAREIPPAGATTYILTLDDQTDNLLWRKIHYRLLPRRTLLLPYNIVEPSQCSKPEARDPIDGSYGTLGGEASFSSPESFGRFLKHHGVTHLLIARGDPRINALVGRSLDPGEMHLLRVDSSASAYTEVAHAAAP